ncbi:hypothetical protein Vadar_028559 [Vaccinium darrowii]|uniref:Uncharacterized protein n=1 Tax=Vaccinium darrowii TaxID=229202 RepID=A0ACB7XU31_9ERIC|nr:hypothetical protein Vadar_028559 [Vaccinium darrowii]
MSELVARTGRQQQRYEVGFRLIAGCIPFKYRNSSEENGDTSDKVVEVLMINSTSGPGLLFPKGKILWKLLVASRRLGPGHDNPMRERIIINILANSDGKGVVRGCLLENRGKRMSSCEDRGEYFSGMVAGFGGRSGGWENDETVAEAALREALEEAGVRGDILFGGILNRDGEVERGGGIVLECFGWGVEGFGDLRDCAELDDDRRLSGSCVVISWTSDRDSARVWEGIEEHFLGYYKFKSKTLRDEFSPEGLCKAAMFALLVKEELPSWPEQSTRQRTWLTIPEAIQCCRHPWMLEALEEGFSKWHANGMISTVKDDNKDEDPVVFSSPSSPDRNI